jgi:hypothetical protein
MEERSKLGVGTYFCSGCWAGAARKAGRARRAARAAAGFSVMRVVLIFSG